jgi:hypothetical protein
MCRKLIFLISLVLVAGLAGSASAASMYYDDGDANNHLWSNQYNWTTHVLPIAADSVRMQVKNTICVVDGNYTTPKVFDIRMGASSTAGLAPNFIEVRGGTLVVDINLVLGYGSEHDPPPGGINKVTVYSGTVNVTGGSISIAAYGSGYFWMKGGTANVFKDVRLGIKSASGHFQTGHLQLDGGVINARELHIREYSPTSTYCDMDIRYGKMILTGDQTTKIQGYVDSGWLTAFSGRGDVGINYNDPCLGKTVLTASANLAVAWGPKPKSDSLDVNPSIGGVKWGPGDYVDKHWVYFGTSSDDVNSTASPVSIQDANSYATPLEYSNQYFWRIDEVNGVNRWEGTLWNFTTPDYLLVDGFETYTDTNNLLLTWSEGGGADISLDTAVVNEEQDSTKSMKCQYNGDSEAYRSFSTSQDWSSYGLTGLDVWFYGDFGNSDSVMYVGIEDDTAHYAEVENGDPGIVKSPAWQVWNVDLAGFAGVDLTKVKKLHIGFSSGSGTVYFDDLRVYPCRSGGLDADLNGDCQVDFRDFAELAKGWLVTKLW